MKNKMAVLTAVLALSFRVSGALFAQDDDVKPGVEMKIGRGLGGRL